MEVGLFCSDMVMDVSVLPSPEAIGEGYGWVWVFGMGVYWNLYASVICMQQIEALIKMDLIFDGANH